MNVTASKVLLALSVAAYTYCSWDHIVPSKKADAAPGKSITLTAAIVNHVEALSLGRDVFDSIQIDRGVGDVNALPGDDLSDAGPAAAGAAPSSAPGATAVGAGGGAAPTEALALQGVFMTPQGHAALINGTPVTEGEVTTLGAGGAKILATRIGDDYAIIVCRGQTTVLKLSDPRAKSADGGSFSSSSGSNSASGSPPPAAARNGWSDPYAGHRTGHHQ